MSKEGEPQKDKLQQQKKTHIYEFHSISGASCSFIQINSDLNHLIVNPFICTVHVCVVAEVCLRL